MIDENEIYFYEIICWNCGFKEKCRITKGITVLDFCLATKCFNCGCNRKEI